MFLRQLKNLVHILLLLGEYLLFPVDLFSKLVHRVTLNVLIISCIGLRVSSVLENNGRTT